MHHQLRRKDKAMSSADALALLSQAEFGVLSLADNDGMPYGVPLNFAVVGNEIAFHCAMEGRKLDTLRQNPRASFCVVPQAKCLPEELSFAYRSVIASGSVREVTDTAELRRLLCALVEKYTQYSAAQTDAAITADLPRVCVFTMSIEAVCGKASYPDALPPNI